MPKNDKNAIFSKEALAKLRSPDKLDSLFPVISPVSWAGLLTVCFLLFAVLMWSIFGSLVEKVEGTGVILNSGGVTKVFSLANGKVDSVLIKPGDMVKKGQILATVFNPNTEIDYQLSKDNTSSPMSEIQSRQLKTEFDAKRYSRMYNSTITSPCNGVVDQLSIAPEMMIGAGSSVCVIRDNDDLKELGGAFYVSAPEGHKVQPGMLLQLSPGGYNEERDGQLVGVVFGVSKYHVDQDTICRMVKSTSLASAIMSGHNNACLEVRFRLIKDRNSTTGYLWTSGKGPTKNIEPGTMVTGYAVVERMPPIEKVFYKIKSLLRSR